MLILGVADNHDSGAALLADGHLVAACSQERIDRVKCSGAFPWGAIDAVLDRAGVRAREVDRVVFGTSFTPSWALRRFPARHAQAKAERGQFDPALNAYILYQVALRRTGLHTLEIEANERLLAERMRARGFARAELGLMDHHEAHANAAYRAQPHERSLLLTVDAMGDGVSCTASVGQVGQINRHWTQSGMAAVNTFYSRITEWLGFRANRHEGKITGLAAYATAPPPLLEHLRRQLRFVGPGFTRENYLRVQRRDDAFYAELLRYTREEVAAAAQAVLEEAVTAFVSYWVERTDVRDVAVCGGVFANVKLNQRIAALDCVNSLYVFPHMGDGGLPVGAALGSGGAPPGSLPTLYLGPEYSPSHIARELNIAQLRPTRGEDPEGLAVEVLARGGLLGRFDGAMEFGPRALGNRSVLARPDLPDITAQLNSRLQRSEFMPFAPIVLAEDAPRLFHGLHKAPESARHMTVCFDCTDELRRVAPAVVHVDGTARPQVVHDEDNPALARLLRRVKARTGLPVLLNTSFNMHEEPIVCSPFDAQRAFRAARLDGLWIGGHFVAGPVG